MQIFRIAQVATTSIGLVMLSAATVSAHSNCAIVNGWGGAENIGTAKVQANDDAKGQAEAWAAARATSFSFKLKDVDCDGTAGNQVCRSKGKVCAN